MLLWFHSKASLTKISVCPFAQAVDFQGQRKYFSVTVTGMHYSCILFHAVHIMPRSVVHLLVAAAAAAAAAAGHSQCEFSTITDFK